MDLVQRLWNGRWGKLARRDIWLYTDGARWFLRARQGDGDSKVWTHDYTTEDEARTVVEGMIARTGGTGEWRDITDAFGPTTPRP